MNLAPGQVYGRGAVLPRLSFELVARTPREKMAVQIHHLHAQLEYANEVLGSGSVTGIWVSFSDSRFSIEIPISRQALAHIDDHTAGDRLDLHLSLSGWLHVRRDADLQESRMLSTPEPGEWGFVSVGRGSVTQLIVQVGRSDWLKQVLEPIGTLEYVLSEIALPKGAAGSSFSVPLSHLAEAERQYALGHDADVFAHCKAMTETLPGWPKQIFAALTDRDKAESLDALLKEAVDYFNRGRHPAKQGVQQGQFPVDHRDARFAVMLSKVLLAEVASVVSAPQS
jgi:hypothetical protein